MARTKKNNVPKSIEKEQIGRKELIKWMATGHILKLQKSWSQGKLRETFQRAYD